MTEQVARSVEVPFPVDTHSIWLSPRDANAGTARRLAMDEASLLAGQRGIVMTTDADAIALPDWVMLNVQALASGADVVCGQAEIDPQDAALIPAHLHADDALEREYAEAWFEKCYFQITLDLAKAAPAKGFRVSRVTLI